MSVQFGTEVVNRNLLLNLDFANTSKCYNGSENMIDYSRYNSGTWTNVFPANATITSGISAPDGTNTAIRFSCATTGMSLLRVTIPPFTPDGSTKYTISVYVRLISGTTTSTGGLGIDLSDGNPIGDYLPLLVANKWVRVSFTGTPTATSKTSIDLLSDNTNNYVLDFWGLQLEKGESASPYAPTFGTTVTRPYTLIDPVSKTSFNIGSGTNKYISYDETYKSVKFTRNEVNAVFTGSISGTVLTVTAVTSGTITANMSLNYAGATVYAYISSLGTGTGGTGTYNISTSITQASTTITGTVKLGGRCNTTVTSPELLSNTYLYKNHTTEIWAKINDSAPSNTDITEGASALAVFAGWHSMYSYDSTGIKYTVWDATGPTIYNTSTLVFGTHILLGTWFNLAITKDGTSFKTYLNGSLIFTNNITISAYTGVTNILSIGAAYDGGPGGYHYHSKSNVGAFKMYNDALTADEVKQNFNARRGRYGI